MRLERHFVVKAWLSDDRRAFHHEVGGWHGEFPVEELPRWIAFYRHHRDRLQGRYAHYYAEDVKALEALVRQLEEAGHGPA